MTEFSNPNDIVVQMAKTLGVQGIDESTLHLCVILLDQGVDPSRLASSIKKINNETKMMD